MWQIAVEEMCINAMQLNNYLNVRFTLKCCSKSINGFIGNLLLVLGKNLKKKKKKKKKKKTPSQVILLYETFVIFISGIWILLRIWQIAMLIH